MNTRVDEASAVHPAIPWLKHENARFHELLRGLSEADWRKPTLCTEWCAAQVVGHMTGGSASYAERISAAIEGRVILGLGAQSAEEFQAARQAILEEVAALPGPERVARIVEADRRLEEVLDRLKPGHLDRGTWHRKGDLPLRNFPGQRLGEVVLHRRDLANDPDAAVESEALGVLARVLSERFPRQFSGAPQRDLTGRFRVEVTDPGHAFTLEARDGVLRPVPDAERWDARFRSSASDMILLATGRAGRAEREKAGRLRIEGDRQKAEALMRSVFRPI